jgi:hypothetical protein
VNFALRWFPDYSAMADPLTLTPAPGTAYGQFSRLTPIYPGTNSWQVGLVGGSIYDPDPLASPQFGGTDPELSGRASLTVIPEPGGLALLSGMLGLLGFRRRRP